MSDNRGHDWLDDATAERLLRGAHGDDRVDEAWRDERAAALAGLLAAAAAPAPLDPRREEAAVAAFRAARDKDALSGGVAGVHGGRAADDWSPDAGSAGPRAGSGAGGSRSARYSRRLTGTLIATAAVAGVGVAAAAGALPALLGDGVPSPTPVHTRGAATDASDSGPVTSGRTASPTSRPGHGPERPAGGATGKDSVVTPGRPAGTPASTAAADYTALCRAYAAAGWHRKNMDEQAYKQLRKAVGGGQGQVRRYCAGRLGSNAGTPGSTGNTGSAVNGGKTGKEGKTAKADKVGDDDSQDGHGRWRNRSGGHHRHGGHGSRRGSEDRSAAPSDGRSGSFSGHGDE
ncbi:hypothetical protein [Streptomyces sp. NPDC001070]